MDKKSGRQEEMSFWEHLDALRGVMFRVIAVLFVSAVALFVFMPWIFNNIILAPCRSDFVVYGLLDRLAQALPALGLNDSMSDFRVDLTNILPGISVLDSYVSLVLACLGGLVSGYYLFIMGVH